MKRLSLLLIIIFVYSLAAYAQIDKVLSAGKLNDDSKYSKMPKPTESTYFITGQKFKPFSVTDIKGNKLDLSSLTGKVVVINFWFIACAPCVMEIPDLNRIAIKYANDPDVVFIGIAMDDKNAIEQFIKTNPFGYHLINSGVPIAGMYKINMFPTNVVLNKQGKVLFHSSGYALNTPYWIGRSIEEAKQKSL